MLVRRSPLAAVGVLLVLTSWGLVGCGGSGDSGDSGSPGSSSSSAVVTQATGSPFTATLTGPELAEAGQTITTTLTNTGRLPNQFQLEFDPMNAAVATPRTVELAPGQSTQIQLQVMVSPFDVNVESAAGGLGDYLATLEVGSDS